MERLTFAYKPKPWIFLLAGAFFAVCGFVIANAAIGNHRGMSINRITPLSPDQASILLWVLFAACVVFVLFALLGAVRGLGAGQQIVLDDRAITAPNGLRGKLVTIPYSAITGARTIRVGSQDSLEIRHGNGKLNIARTMLPSAADFSSLSTELDRRLARSG